MKAYYLYSVWNIIPLPICLFNFIKVSDHFTTQSDTVHKYYTAC